MRPAPQLQHLPQEVPTEKDNEKSEAKLSEVVKIISDNNLTVRQITIQLEELQNWIRKQEKLFNEKTK